MLLQCSVRKARNFTIKNKCYLQNLIKNKLINCSSWFLLSFTHSFVFVSAQGSNWFSIFQVPADEVCGCPLVKDVFEPTGEFCRVSKRKCNKHYCWEKLRRAEVDLERVRVVNYHLTVLTPSVGNILVMQVT